MSEASEKIWISRVNSGSGSFFSHFKYELHFHFLKLIKKNYKIFQIEIKKAPQSCEVHPKKGNLGKKWHYFCSKAKINFFLLQKWEAGSQLFGEEEKKSQKP